MTATRGRCRRRHAGTPSGFPFVRASSCCLFSSVKYVWRRSFGVTGSTPACSAMVRTRTITAWAVMSPRLDAPALGDRAQQGARPVPAVLSTSLTWAITPERKRPDPRHPSPR